MSEVEPHTSWRALRVQKPQIDFSCIFLHFPCIAFTCGLSRHLEAVQTSYMLFEHICVPELLSTITVL